MSIVIDYTHVGRAVTGIERITLELFTPEMLGRTDVTLVRAGGKPDMIRRQWVTLPALAARGDTDLVLCPGFPPSMALTTTAASKTLPYIHDLFLLSRPDLLNTHAKLYMRPSFALAVRRLKRFLVNSEHTAAELRRWCRADAAIDLLRPPVANIFGLSPDRRLAGAEAADAPLRLLSLGTIEPRKNYPAAVALRRALEARLGRPVTLDIIGRIGWGDDHAQVAADPGTRLHEYVPDAGVRALIDQADLFLSTSREEGLGLPLLEVQHSGIAVVASDIPASREVLDGSGLMIDPAAPDAAAAAVAAMLARPDWRAVQARAALANADRWNRLAAADATAFRASLPPVR